ncbi:archaellin/type IV pilin N-terminal domain-containing protein [Candidatus Lucifugimonas marina]
MITNKLANVDNQQQRGITGLETAIILIAFVVVASVFSFTVLSTGVFASERSKETVYAGLEEAKSSLEPRGSVIAFKGRAGTTTDDDTIYKIQFVLGNAIAGEPVDLTPPYTADATNTDPDISSGAEYKTVISYQDKNQYLSDVPWTIKLLGQSSNDYLLEQGEKAEITVWLLQRLNGVSDPTANDGVTKYSAADANGSSGILTAGTLLDENDQFTLEVKPESGSTLAIQRTTPARLDAIMDLK